MGYGKTKKAKLGKTNSKATVGLQRPPTVLTPATATPAKKVPVKPDLTPEQMDEMLADTDIEWGELEEIYDRIPMRRATRQGKEIAVPWTRTQILIAWLLAQGYRKYEINRMSNGKLDRYKIRYYECDPDFRQLVLFFAAGAQVLLQGKAIKAREKCLDLDPEKHGNVVIKACELTERITGNIATRIADDRNRAKASITNLNIFNISTADHHMQGRTAFKELLRLAKQGQQDDPPPAELPAAAAHPDNVIDVDVEPA